MSLGCDVRLCQNGYILSVIHYVISHYCTIFHIINGDHMRVWSPASARMVATTCAYGRRQLMYTYCKTGKTHYKNILTETYN